ncbi:MAG: NUDIX hydrolase [bacterium]|nr:NUDIX hydrolase [bacterium]
MGSSLLKRLLMACFRRMPEPLQWCLQRLILPSFLVGVVGVVPREDGMVLVCRHTYRRQPWGLPSGWLRPGESAEDCICREVAEETGLAIEADGVRWVGSDARRRRVDIVIQCRVVGHRAFRPSHEVDSVRWIGPPDLRDAGLHQATRRVLRDFWAED